MKIPLDLLLADVGSASRVLSRQEQHLFEVARKRAKKWREQGNERLARMQWTIARDNALQARSRRRFEASQRVLSASPTLVEQALHGEYLYHLTPWPKLAMIRRAGLDPYVSRRVPAAVFLTNEGGFPQWKSWATSTFVHEYGDRLGSDLGEPVVVLRVPTRKLSRSALSVDWAGTSDARMFQTLIDYQDDRREQAIALTYEDVIPPEHLEWARIRLEEFKHSRWRHLHRVRIEGPWLRLQAPGSRPQDNKQAKATLSVLKRGSSTRRRR